MSNDPEHCLFANASVETSFGTSEKIKCRVPIMTGVLGSTVIAANYWPSFAVSVAICGFPIFIGENVVGVDRESIMSKGKIAKAPELDRRIDSFFPPSWQ